MTTKVRLLNPDTSNHQALLFAATQSREPSLPGPPEEQAKGERARILEALQQGDLCCPSCKSAYL